MSAENCAVPARDGPEVKSVVTRVANLALVSCACGAVAAAYESTKESHPCVRSVCQATEKGVKTLTAAAVSGAQPLLTRFNPPLFTSPVSSANELACKGLDKLEEKLPILQQPPERVVAGTRELVSGAVARTLGTVTGTRVGRLLVTGVGTVLGRPEQLVGRYLPRTEEELAATAGAQVAQGTKVGTAGPEVAPGTEVGTAGPEVAPGPVVSPPGWQRRWQSCFVRVGSLSAELRHRALRRSLGELRRARHSAQHLLAQLHHLIQLIEEGQRGSDGPRSGSRERLHRLWLEWSRQEGVPMEESEVEARALAMLRGLLQQLHGACARLASGARAFPSSVQETAGHVRHGVEGVQAALARARSFHDLSELVLAQSRDGVARAQLGIEELLEHVGQHMPLPWLVGPFAPALVEYPEDAPVDMAKWEGCVTVGGTRQAPAAPRVCSQR
ncbi:PREDICTED: perilipin-3-like isoform X5 [Lepidothrix coronata]|uniref:Perilipin n=1 Tax=Lepidothrix coronata TaxID=321398 RepID=A0A6J0IT34_9PASS|nr:PREDICTED: perilipin-3-like isoform X5 [Lepidothrix coronata]